MAYKNVPNVIIATPLKSRYEHYMVSHHSSAILHFSSFKILEGMLFTVENFLLFVFNDVSDEDSSSDSFLKESLVQQPQLFYFWCWKRFLEPTALPLKTCLLKFSFGLYKNDFTFHLPELCSAHLPALEESSTLYEKRYCSKRLLHFVA